MPDTQPEDDTPSDEIVKRLTPLRRQRGPRLGKPKVTERIIGIDGEGVGRSPHLYNYIAASDESGESWGLAAESLSTKQCLDFMLGLPRATVVAFSFSYDLTKILAELTDKQIHKLLHPERRRKFKQGKVTYRPIHWGEYRLNYMNGRFSVAKYENEKRGPYFVLWDIWRFYQSRFTKALTDWGIATEQQLEFMASMKAKRDSFDSVDPLEVQRYCREECMYLARLFRELLNAHTDAGLVLKTYFGAGSTSSALLLKMGIKEQVREGPKEARYAIASAFFGGRFENRAIGPIPGPLFDSDISSAYPYHSTLLPCLGHGSWHHTNVVLDRDVTNASLALVHWTLPTGIPKGQWGPYPVRGKDGCIVFPWSAPEGWVWGKEYLAGKVIAPHAKGIEAWYYHTECQCKPFGELPFYYLERIRVGKNTGRGKVFKLGPNGVYGKLAQTVGLDPPFQSFVWAGVITSNTRAQLLEALSSKPTSVIALATDGILSTEPLTLPKPVDTGTFGAEFPLGGWEQDTEGGRFLARPGISFPLDGKGKVKSRGYAKKHIEAQKDCIQQAWAHGHDWCIIDDGEQFGSAKAMLHLSAKGYSRSDRFGEWFRTYTMMTFDPAPKRVRIPDTNILGVIDWTEPSLPFEAAL